jgi:sporulation protein YlmC with PRC-barrel domain
MRVQLIQRKRFSRTFHIRSREIWRFLLTALHEIWAPNLYSYMKASLLFGTAFTILGMAGASVFAQTQTTTSSSSSGYIQTSKIVGTKVKTSQGEDIGVVKDVVLDSNTGCMAYTVLSAGGTGTRVTGQAKTVAVPWAVYTPSTDMSVLTVRVDRDRIYNAPVFDYARINEYETTGYINNVYSYYGVTPQPGIGVSGGTSGTTTTGVTGAATGAASPMATASPRATRSSAAPASSRANASPRTRYSPAEAASPGATASPGAAESTASPHAARGRTRSHATPSPSQITEAPSSGATEASPGEATTSPSERTRSSRHHRGEPGSKAEPSGTPESPQEQE